MRVLILDDEPWRHEGFDLMLLKHQLTHAYTVDKFAHWLGDGPYDLVCFDHDLGQPTTGMDAARAFVASNHPRTTCLVHSWNPFGAAAIANVLHKAGHRVLQAPFSTSLKHLLDDLAA
jgi:DNA-binding NarL/FixJ family response regulator